MTNRTSKNCSYIKRAHQLARLTQRVLQNRYYREFLRLLNADTNRPHQVALSFVTGFYLGIIPVIGTTTFLGLLFSSVFKLNHLVVQGLNVILSPVQLLFAWFFLKTGNELFFRGRPVIPAGFWQSGTASLDGKVLFSFIETLSAGLVVWFILAVITSPVLFTGTVRFIRRLQKNSVQL